MAGILKPIEEELLAIVLYESFVRAESSGSPRITTDLALFYDFNFKMFKPWHSLDTSARKHWRDEAERIYLEARDG